MTKKGKSEKLQKEIKRCRKCVLCETRKNTVPGEGSLNAKIMAIGQAPGEKEDETGKPFIGRAGKFLTELLNLAGIEREKIFITSPIKCFPPKNRKPDKIEIAACLPYLERQIKIINPKKIIILGQIPFNIFFPEKRLNNFRGKWLKKDNKEFFISYHPAAGVRFQKFKKTLEKDFKTIKNKI